MNVDYNQFDGPAGVEVRVSTDEGYRTCSECGGDCYPDPSAGADGIGVRIAFVCPSTASTASLTRSRTSDDRRALLDQRVDIGGRQLNVRRGCASKALSAPDGSSTSCTIPLAF